MVTIDSRRRRSFGFRSVALLAGCAILVACDASSDPVGSPTQTTSSGPADVPTRPIDEEFQQPKNVFGPYSVWRRPVGSAPVAPSSARLVTNLVGQVKSHYSGTAAFNAYHFNASWYTVGAHQATITVHYSNCQHKASTPLGLFGRGGQFVDVPIPNGAAPSVGTDAEMSIYRPSTNQLWDFWRIGHGVKGWQACWGGRIDRVSTNPGYFLHGFGATATGLASEAGDVSIADARSGSINHAIALQIPSPAARRDVSWPAQRSDGSSTLPGAIPEGTHFRLDPSLNIESLNLSRLASMIARAGQKYGFIVTDRSGSVAVAAESGTPTQRVTGTNPWDEILEGTKPFRVLEGFPWQYMQALPKDYGK